MQMPLLLSHNGYIGEYELWASIRLDRDVKYLSGGVCNTLSSHPININFSHNFLGEHVVG